MLLLDVRSPGAQPAADLHACLDRLTELDVDRLGDSERTALLGEVSRAESRLASVRLGLLAGAERARTAVRAGVASTGQWAAQLSRTDQAESHRQVTLAQGLDRMKATRASLAAGDLSPSHAAVIVRADRDLPPTLSQDDRARVERDLVARAQDVSPEALRRLARRAVSVVEADQAVVDAHENALVRDEEEAARARTRLTLHDNGDGTVSGHFTVPTMHGDLLRKIVQTITAPRRGRLGASTAQVGASAGRTDWDRARGEALCELIEHLPTDHLHPRSAATVLVTMQEDVLRGALRAARLDTGTSLSAGEARRLACTSGLVPAVLGGASLPLDLGRSSRLFSETQRVALSLHHRTCAAEGCERSFAWCELHHDESWSSGGSTDLANADPLCHFHHRRVHDDGFRHERLPDGSLRFHRRT